MRFRFSKATLLKVIAFTVLSAFATLLLAMKIGNFQFFSHTYTLNAQFADASGVFKGDAVKLAGVDVGRVDSAHIVAGHAVVTFSVDRDVVLAKDSTVAIRWRNVLGQRFLYLYPGHAQARYVDGQTVPLSQTQDAGDLGEFLNHLGPILRAIDPSKANAFLDAVNGALGGNETAVRQLIDNSAQLASSLGADDQQIKTLIDSSNTVLSTYAAQDQEIALILDDLNQVGGRLHGMTGDINSLITNFADVQQQLNRLLTENRTNIDTSFQELDSVLGTLTRNKANLATTLCTLPAGLAGYFQTTSWGEWFNVRIVEVILKDNHGNVVGRVPEQPRPTKAQPAYSHCAGSPSGTQTSQAAPARAAGPSGRTGSSGGAPPPPAPPTPLPGFQDVGSFVDYVLQGGNRA